MYVYLYSREDRLYTVGFYAPEGKWEAESDWGTSDEAAERAAWLNGATYPWAARQDVKEFLKAAFGPGRLQ